MNNFSSLFLVMLGLHCREGFSLVAERGICSSCGAGASHCSGVSCCRAWETREATRLGLTSYGSQAPEHRLNSCGALKV